LKDRIKNKIPPPTKYGDWPSDNSHLSKKLKKLIKNGGLPTIESHQKLGCYVAT
jgi:hypothetical protein